MLSKDELTKVVAQSCGVSIEISSFFFEVFVNRLSNKLKPGDLLHFHNHGFFHKRNCRIQIEKSSDSPTPKSYLIQLVLFSSESKIRSDLSDIHFLKIPNLKTLWLDDKEFQKSLKSGDFAPYTERNQLIKSFATKAEVIISGLRKDFDSDLNEELVIPLTFDLNFLVKRSQKGLPGNGKSSATLSSEKKSIPEKGVPAKVVEKQEGNEKLSPDSESKVDADNGLPWNYGTKFLDKDKVEVSETSEKESLNTEAEKRKIISTQARELRREQAARLKEFEPVSSPHSAPKRNSIEEEVDTVKFNVSPTKSNKIQKSTVESKFTEVKSKTESYHQTKYGRAKNGKYDKYASLKISKDKSFTPGRNYLPIVAIITFIVIASIVVYIYFFSDDLPGTNSAVTFSIVDPPEHTNVVERDYQFTVSYPYPKKDNNIEVTGFNRAVLFGYEIDEDIPKDLSANQLNETITKNNKGNNSETNVKPKEDKTENVEPLVVEKEEPKTEVVTEQRDRIFLYRGFYVVYIDTYKSETRAEQEANKYFDLGYNAIIETVESRGRGREYKLNVGDFTSEEFAKQFEEQYIK